MRPTKDELETDYYKRFLKYCSGKCVPDLSPPRHKKYKAQDLEDTASTCVSVRKHSKGQGTTAPSIDPKEFMELKRTFEWLTAQYGKRPDAEETPFHRSYDDHVYSSGPRHNDVHEFHCIMQQASDYATDDPIPKTPVEVETNTVRSRNKHAISTFRHPRCGIPSYTADTSRSGN